MINWLNREKYSLYRMLYTNLSWSENKNFFDGNNCSEKKGNSSRENFPVWCELAAIRGGTGWVRRGWITHLDVCHRSDFIMVESMNARVSIL